MKKENWISRRLAVKSSIFGLLAVSIPNIIFSKNILPFDKTAQKRDKVSDRYPAIDEDIVSEVVGVSHFNLDRLKTLVEARPELARATWDWGFGDWESAIGAASHVGRKDIVEFLMTKGARPNIFTFAMLGGYEAVKSMVEFYPGVQRILGPHGISLLQHVKVGIRANTGNKLESGKLLDYLERLGDADGEQYLEVEEQDKQKYLGNYKYGDDPNDGFTISLNMRKLLALGKIGKFGGALYKIRENTFIYNGAPSVEITFSVKDGKISSLTVNEPNLMLTALKIN